MLVFVLGIAGAAALLIYAVRMVRTGVERAFAIQLRRLLRASSGNRVTAALTGAGVAVCLQSATAVAMLAAGFVAAGTLSGALALAMLLGADVGSALVVQVLTLRPDWLAPLLLLIGVVLFMRSEAKPTRQAGRIVIGLALIFVALDMIATATGPLRDSAGLAAAMRYLEADLITAFAIGAVFAWAVHSSVAAVLLMMTLAGQGLMPAGTAIAMVLGANLGGSFIAVALTLGAEVTARRFVWANLAVRGGGAAAALALAIVVAPDWSWLGATPERQVINLHLAFNLAVAVLGLPLVPLLMAGAGLVLRQRQALPDPLERRSALDPAALSAPDRALSCAAREVLHMGEEVEAMLRPALHLYVTWDETTARSMRLAEARLDRMHVDIKRYLAGLAPRAMDEAQNRRSAELMELSAHLKSAGSTIARDMLDLARKMHAGKLRFSPAGLNDLEDFHDRVLANAQASLNVQMSQDPEAARALVAEKERVRETEQRMQRAHLQRLRQDNPDSFATSNIHQETLRALKQINTALTIAAYPILTETGDLLASRLSNAPREHDPQ